jgi:hypothetical protein
VVVCVVGVLAVLFGGLVGSQAGLTLEPDHGQVGDSVTASQAVDGERCTTYTVFFDGAPVGEDDGSGGFASVGFSVPDLAPDPYEVVAECSFLAGGDEVDEIVGRESFRIDGEPSTTPVPTTVTTTEPPDTTSTTRTDVTTTVTDGTVPPPPDDLAECEAEASEAEAELAYEPERAMVVGDDYEVTAALSLSGRPDVTFQGTTTIIVLPDVHCSITAVLTGADFDITAKSNATQSFLDTRVLDWRWDVRPRRHGDDLALTLSLQALLIQEGETVPGRTTLHVAVIDVDVEPVSFWRQLGRDIEDFLTQPLVAPVTGLALGALATWIAQRAHRKYKERRAAAAPAEPAATPGPTPDPGTATGPAPEP